MPRQFPTLFNALLLATVTAVVPLGLVGCETDTANVRSNRLQQYTTVQATPPEVADAAAEVLEGLDLRNIERRATSVDAVVTGETARGEGVEISVEREGQNESDVTVWIGKLGDPGLGQQILERIRERLDRVSS